MTEQVGTPGPTWISESEWNANETHRLCNYCEKLQNPNSSVSGTRVDDHYFLPEGTCIELTTQDGANNRQVEANALFHTTQSGRV